MEFIELIKVLEAGLQQPLPGRAGQVRMAPIPLEEERFDQGRSAQARKGAVLLLFCSGPEGIMIPFIKRAIYEGVHSGQIALPGGKMDPEDPDLSYTARRETEEEIGVDRKSISIIGALSDLYIPPSNFSVRPFVGYTSDTPVFNIDPREVDRLVPCSLETLLHREGKKEQLEINTRGTTIKAPYYEINNEVVWGATAMILSEFLTIWKKIR
ncbi:NUDIX domain-containing protein [Cyclobacterium lianum]|uniref:NUDIX domain-containing protein n=2 Tax=Cyclobacterium lianum TaxID=388280 RepID=A0A1M7PAB3_9BACT|nr:NUDIX domain-containing protein [Cyclobacterium lianum]